MSKPKKTKKPNRTGKALNVWIEPRLRDALDAYIAAQKPAVTLTAAVEYLLGLSLANEGHWPPPGDAAD